ncbi:hypothetical protein [Bacteroides thetaiotaomicron]|uniref:hypothetical protein n=1 Tax=Bacteroides thetaiotaomicron TaxID=818 RepID=UPI002165226C|nr:hypothetical protein [Bacteroides thetaiotaomicron]MCS2364187.1 hypothetical protein [Bacteroides thetaiotaomicron]
MPNKKTKTVKIRHLECFSAIYGELAQNPEYADYEIEEAVLQVKSYIPPTVKDVDKAIEKIRFSHATRKYKYPVFEGRELIDQKTLAKMAGVSRQTVARWGGTRFHIPFGHRAVGKQIFRNKRSRFPT